MAHNTLRVTLARVSLAALLTACGSQATDDAKPGMMAGVTTDGQGTTVPSTTIPTSTDTAMTPSMTGTMLPTATPPTSGEMMPSATTPSNSSEPPSTTGTMSTVPADPTMGIPMPSDTAAPTSTPTQPSVSPTSTDTTTPMPDATDTQVPEPPVPVERPSLVTTSDGNWWQTGEVTEAPDASPDVSVDVSAERQTWLGFGGTFNEAGWDALNVLDAAEKQRAVDLLFDAATGANFAWGRFPLGASDYAIDRYTLSEQADDFEMSAFSIDRDKELLIPFIQAALAVKPEIRLWTSPWSPPAWMKQNNSMDGGRIKDDAAVLQAYALYMARFIEDYAAEGISIESIHPQNEPGYETRYPSCLWTPQLLRDFVRDYMGPTFEERGITSEIWLGTMSAPEDVQHVTTMMSDAEAKKYIKGVGLQWNTMDSAGKFASDYGVPVMQTEHKCGNYHWLSGFNPDKPQNDYAYAEESWGLIRDWLKAGVSVYSAWNMVLDIYGKNLDPMRPWPQNALLTVDRDAKTLNITPAYYVFRHLSYFVDPGAIRVDVTGNADALAFKNPDGSIVTVLYNSGGQAKATTLGVGETALQFSVPARGWATVNWH